MPRRSRSTPWPFEPSGSTRRGAMDLISRWKAAAAAFAVAATFTLAACIISPGKFESTFDVRRDGSFTFTYNGQIHLLALSRLAEMSQAEAGQFVEAACYDEETF